jgi:hypothetical protein
MFIDEKTGACAEAASFGTPEKTIGGISRYPTKEDFIAAGARAIRGRWWVLRDGTVGDARAAIADIDDAIEVLQWKRAKAEAELALQLPENSAA